MIRVVAALAVTMALGLLSRLRPIGWPPYDKSLGDVLYAIAVYFALCLALFRKPRAFIVPLACGLCLAVECFKTTGFPAHLARNYPVAGWLIGTTFSWHNLACYALGIVIVVAIDIGLLRPKQGFSTPPAGQLPGRNGPSGE